MTPVLFSMTSFATGREWKGLHSCLGTRESLQLLSERQRPHLLRCALQNTQGYMEDFFK